MSTPQPNRTITDIRAKLRLGGTIARDAIKEVVEAWKAQEGHLGKTADQLGISRSSLERARKAIPALAQALTDAQTAQDVFTR